MKKSKKIISAVISMVMAVSFIQTSAVQVFAEDTNALSKWAQEDVGMSYLYKLSDAGMYKGYQKNVTKEELYTVAVDVYKKLTGNNPGPVSSNPFNDTNNENVLKACSIGILEGSGNSFEPTKTITREDAAVVLYNTITASEPKFNFNVDTKLSFNDSVLSKESTLKAVKYLYSKGLLKGKTANSLDLSSNCIKEEVLVLGKRVYEFSVRESGMASKGCLWKVTGGNSEVYLLGSIHVADMSLYPLSKGLEDSYNKSDYLVVEANVTPSNQDLAYMAEKAMYTEDSIEKHISADTYKEFVKKMEKHNIKPDVYNKLKPWYAALSIPNLSLADKAISGNLGVDVYLLNKAANKQLIELEGIKFQVDMFDNFSPVLQEQYLKSTLAASKVEGSNDGKDIQDVKRLLASWKEGDLTAFEKLVNTTPVDEYGKEFNKKLLDERNGNMVNKVKGFLDDKSGKTYFVVVGAAHYFGDTGILKALKDQGFKVEQILN